jgi:hypothetical protein
MGKVFRHECMSLIWLRKQTPHLDSYRKYKGKYSPDRCFNSGYYLCGIALSDNGECKYCGSDLSNEISTCAITGSITERMKKILRHAERWTCSKSLFHCHIVSIHYSVHYMT